MVTRMSNRRYRSAHITIDSARSNSTCGSRPKRFRPLKSRKNRIAVDRARYASVCHAGRNPLLMPRTYSNSRVDKCGDRLSNRIPWYEGLGSEEVERIIDEDVTVFVE